MSANFDSPAKWAFNRLFARSKIITDTSAILLRILNRNYHFWSFHISHIHATFALSNQFQPYIRTWSRILSHKCFSSRDPDIKLVLVRSRNYLLNMRDAWVHSAERLAWYIIKCIPRRGTGAPHRPDRLLEIKWLTVIWLTTKSAMNAERESDALFQKYVFLTSADKDEGTFVRNRGCGSAIDTHCGSP